MPGVRAWCGGIDGSLLRTIKATRYVTPLREGRSPIEAPGWPTEVRYLPEDLEHRLPGAESGAATRALRRLGDRRGCTPVIRAVAPLKEGDVVSLAPEAVADLATEGLWALEELYGAPSSNRVAQEVKNAHWLNLGLLFDTLQKAADSCAKHSR
ncbi:hypothetical protein BH24ACT22_BH24ACT22_11850 [soil metagenome]